MTSAYDKDCKCVNNAHVKCQRLIASMEVTKSHFSSLIPGHRGVSYSDLDLADETTNGISHKLCIILSCSIRYSDAIFFVCECF